MSGGTVVPAKRRRQGSIPGMVMMGLGSFILWTLAIGLSTPLTLAGGVVTAVALAAWTRAADL